MTCEHTHKDAPENAVCEDCYGKKILREWEMGKKELLHIINTFDKLLRKKLNATRDDNRT